MYKGPSNNHDQYYTTRYIFSIHKRDIRSVFIGETLRKKITDKIDYFKNNKEIYIKHNINYHLNIMFYGPPGTGKSSLINAVCTYMGRHVLAVAVNGFYNESSLADIDYDKFVLVMEDIDSSSYLLKPETIKSLYELGDREMVVEMKSHDIGYTNFINKLDSLMSPSGLVTVMTTNHIDILRESIYRPGRIDLLLEIGYVNKSSLDELTISRLGKTFDVKVREGLTMSDLVDRIDNTSEEEFIKYVSEGY